MPTIKHNQYTLKRTVSCCGIGLHSGRSVHLAIVPATVDSGINFIRTDLPGSPSITASTQHVVDTRLATTIGNDAFTISTIEHLMAALHSFGIDNAQIEVDSPELPIMDGSARPFVDMLQRAGKKKQKAYRQVIRITQPVTYRKGDKFMQVTPYNGFKITGTICFDDALIQKQSFTFDLYSDSFKDSIAKARTFGYVEEVEELWANGLAQGGSLANVIAIHWNRKSVLNEDGLRYQDEFIRHKVLDLLGDIYLLGCPVLGHIESYKAGHTEHLGLMQAISDAPHCYELIDFKPKAATKLAPIFSPGKGVFPEESVVFDR